MPEHYGFCARCQRELFAGRGEFFEVHIRAVADPTSPEIDPHMSAEDAEQEYRALVASLNDVSAREAMDQVFRQQTILLCNDCFPKWYEEPAADNV